MTCPLCGRGKSRRACPALQQTICPLCCGTKRLTEIQCPADCVYLTTAREHPAAMVRRQQERDVALLMPTIASLTERQYQLFFLFHTMIGRHVPEGIYRLIDDDVVEAAATIAATLETAARGVIYDQVPESPPARRLAAEMKGLLSEIRAQDSSVNDGEAAVVLRAIERGARETRQAGSGDVAYLTLMARLLQPARPQAAASPATASASTGGSSLILP